MTLRVCSALLLLLSGCATPAPSPKKQVAPIAPLVVPKPMVAPAPVGLAPPAPLVLVPEGDPVPPPKSSSDKAKEPAPALTSERRPECVPRTVPHLGGDALHNRCADGVPRNAFPGFDVLVNGKRFDALQLGGRVLWEVKTDSFDTYTVALRKIVIDKQALELKRERALAEACGFNFWIGVRSAAHQAALEFEDRTFNIVLMDWC
jgi:hypothetical protein